MIKSFSESHTAAQLTDLKRLNIDVLKDVIFHLEHNQWDVAFWSVSLRG